MTGQDIEVANGQFLTVRGIGDLITPGPCGLTLTEMWHVPGMVSNLISLGQLEDKGITMVKQANGSRILQQANKTIARVKRIGRLYILGNSMEAEGLPAVLQAIST